MVNLPDHPPTFRAPTPAERPWWWRLEDSGGNEVQLGDELGHVRFSNQGDAESWVGETWRDLLAAGVDAVVLHEHDRKVYGPMSLHPDKAHVRCVGARGLDTPARFARAATRPARGNP